MLDVKQSLRIQMPLIATEAPAEKPITFQREDRETGELKDYESNAHSLSGIVMTEDYGEGVYQKVKLSISSNGFQGAITPTATLKKYYENLADLQAGKKYILADVQLNFRGNGEEGAFSLYPQMIDMKIVEADEKDRDFIENFKAVPTTITMM